MTDYITAESLHNFYTPMKEAVEELRRRRESKELQSLILPQINHTPEMEVIFGKPHFVMFRQVLTPLIESWLWLDMAEKYGLSPIMFEYYSDKFVSAGNQFKRSLGKLPIHQFTDRTGREIFEYRTVMDFNAHTGHPIKNVTTLNGRKLTEFHHELFHSIFGVDPETVSFDASHWFKQFTSSKEYYIPFLKLFVRDGILYETFVTNEAEREFFDTVVLPAFNQVIHDTGHKPLVVSIDDEFFQSSFSQSDFYPKLVGEILTSERYS